MVLANRLPTLGPPIVGLDLGDAGLGLSFGTAAYPGIASDSVPPSVSSFSFSPSGKDTAAGLAPLLNTFTDERLLAKCTFFGVVGVVGNDSDDEFADDQEDADDGSGSGNVKCNSPVGADAVLTCALCGDLSNDTADPFGDASNGEGDRAPSELPLNEVILGLFNELFSGFPFDKKMTGDDDVLSTCGLRCAIPRGVSSGADGVGGLGDRLGSPSSLGKGIAFVVGSWIFKFLVSCDRGFSFTPLGVY